MTDEEREEDLKRRQQGHVFMTTEDAQGWNAAKIKRPLADSHWSVKASSVMHVLRIGGAWKRLAKRYREDAKLLSASIEALTKLQVRVHDQDAFIVELEQETERLNAEIKNIHSRAMRSML